MKMMSCLAACLVLAVCSPVLARPFGAATPGMTFTIPSGAVSGPVVIHNPTAPLPTTTIVNNGTVVGGTSPGITVTGSTPTTVINNGAITSATTGVTVSGSSSSTIVNSGTITVKSTSGTATGVSQGGPPEAATSLHKDERCTSERALSAAGAALRACGIAELGTVFPDHREITGKCPGGTRKDQRKRGVSPREQGK